MKIWILPEVGNLTDNWHSGGGLVVCSEDIQSVKALLLRVAEDDGVPEVTEEEWANAISFTVTDGLPGFWIFPDKGCC